MPKIIYEDKKLKVYEDREVHIRGDTEFIKEQPYSVWYNGRFIWFDEDKDRAIEKAKAAGALGNKFADHWRGLAVDG